MTLVPPIRAPLRPPHGGVKRKASDDDCFTAIWQSRRNWGGRGGTVSWNGVLCGHRLGIKIQYWNKCLSSLLILFVFEVPYRPRVKGMPGKSQKLPKVGKRCLKILWFRHWFWQISEPYFHQGVDYAHHITSRSLPSDFQSFLLPYTSSNCTVGNFLSPNLVEPEIKLITRQFDSIWLFQLVNNATVIHVGKWVQVKLFYSLVNVRRTFFKDLTWFWDGLLQNCH